MRLGWETAAERACPLVRGACYLLLAGLTLLFLWVAGSRAAYPYAVEWMEEVVFTDSVRVAVGEQLYPDPESGFAAGVYNPLYQYLVALLVYILGPVMGLGRIVSLASILLAAFVLHLIVKRETRSVRAGLVGASFFIASFPVVGYWYDLARIDSFWICTMLAGFYFVRRRPLGAAGTVAAAACLALSFFTKQLSAYAMAAVFLYLLAVDRRRATLFAALSAAFVGCGILLLQWTSEGWYWFYVFTLPRGFLSRDGMKYNFFYHTGSDVHMGLFYLVRHYPICIAVPVVSILCRVLGKRGALRSGLWFLLFALFILVDGLNYAKSNAWHNSFYTTAAFTSLLTGLLWARIDGIGRGRSFVALLFGLCLFGQLVMLTYDPADHIPREEDRVEGDKFIRTVSKLEGKVWLPHHPYYAYLAGKGFRYTAEASYLSYRLLGRLFDRFIGDVRERNLDYIVIDTEPDWVFWKSVPPLTEALNANYTVVRRFDYGDLVFPKGLDHRQDWDMPGTRHVFMPVEGTQARPLVLMAPKRPHGRRGEGGDARLP